MVNTQLKVKQIYDFINFRPKMGHFWVFKLKLQFFAIFCDFETFTTAGPTLTNDNNGCPDTFAVTAVSICKFVM